MNGIVNGILQSLSRELVNNSSIQQEFVKTISSFATQTMNVILKSSIKSAITRRM